MNFSFETYFENLIESENGKCLKVRNGWEGWEEDKVERGRKGRRLGREKEGEGNVRREG